MTFNVTVCCSGGGGNFQAIIDARDSLDISIQLLIVDRPCGAIDRARKSGIPFIELDSKIGRQAFFDQFLRSIPVATDLIILAGFMPIIPQKVCEIWANKIINTHPSLLPKYGGKGMYGVKVQEAVLAAKEEVAGCTIHFVNAGIDEGSIILQKAISVISNESPWELGGRIFKEENLLLIEAIRLIKNGGNKKEVISEI